jgi:hypothetical protein
MGSFISSCINQFNYYKSLGNKTFDQLSAEQLLLKPSNESNSIAIIITHMHGNMLSRWTDFLTTDGEKPNRNRDAEFDVGTFTKQQLIALWEEGWQCLLNTLNTLTDTDLETIVYIRNQGHTVYEAIIRQMAHYGYHVGQIVYIGKLLNSQFESLSIPLGQSNAFNKEKFEQPKQVKFFANDDLNTQRNDPK